MIRVFIDGEAGTTGLRLHNRLRARDDIKLLAIDPALRKDDGEKARIAAESDVAFLCLPDDAARTAVANLGDSGTVVIDASTAHRTAEGWNYGMPELSKAHREALAGSKRISVPGCYAMGFNLLVYPLVAGGIAAADYPFSCHAVSGYSGAGKKAIAQYDDIDRPEVLGTPRQYALAQTHKHHPEMQKTAGLAFAPIFNPTIADYYAGMVMSVPLHTRLLQKRMDARALREHLADYYAAQPLVRVMPFGAEEQLDERMLDPVALAGQDDVELYVFGDQDRVLLAARYDNLGKGASGAAIQCMNLACGLDETKGLQLG